MLMTPEEARDVVYGEHEDWEYERVDIVGTSRWTTHKSLVSKHVPTGKYYRFDYSVDATEAQNDARPYEYCDVVTPVEVELVASTRHEWKEV